ncbi:uncharacterized protein [Parasteatoda tepidariorum]|nr:abhydrolase domain-containing protein C22H12.03 isoform X1 [Parasteatoda tepidariorum]
MQEIEIIAILALLVRKRRKEKKFQRLMRHPLTDKRHIFGHYYTQHNELKNQTSRETFGTQEHLQAMRPPITSKNSCPIHPEEKLLVTIRIQPVKLAFDVFKPSDHDESNSPPVILLHGITRSKERWSSIQQKLADSTKRLVYALDARNHGDSEKSDLFNFNAITVDVKHFMDTHKISKASFIGHSMGGLAAMELALIAPERVEKIVIEDVSPKEPVPELYYIFGAMIEEQIDCFEHSTNADTEASLNQKLRECIYRTVPMIPDEDLEVIGKIEFPMKKKENGFKPLADLKCVLKAVQSPPICIFPNDKVFDGDALFIYGCQSNFTVIEDEDLILKYFPKAKFYGFETAGHEICSRYPSQFLDKVCNFL